jgi:hypothetical protein
VHERVRHRLVDREDGVGDAFGRDPGGERSHAHELASRPQVHVRDENDVVGVERWRRQRIGERVRHLVGLQVGGAGAGAGGVDDPGMVAKRVVEDGAVERRGVVRAQQPERRAAVEGAIEERLVVGALGQLVGVPSHPDRLADPVDALGVRVLADEVTPDRDQPGRIATDLPHVRELDRRRCFAETVAQEVDLGLGDGDHHRVARLDRVVDERAGGAQELVLAVVEERLVAETA